MLNILVLKLVVCGIYKQNIYEDLTLFVDSSVCGGHNLQGP